MSESKLKKRNKYNDAAINALEKRHGYTKHYIRQVLRGDRAGIIPDIIKKEYKELKAIAEKQAKELASKI